MHKRISLITLFTSLCLFTFCTSALAIPVRSPIILTDMGCQLVFSDLYQAHFKHLQLNKTINKTPSSSPTTPVAKTTITTPTSRGAGSDARLVIKNAQNLLGRSYAYGAEGPDRFDCSGFTRYVFKQAAGVSLPHLASEQINYGKKVLSKSDLLPGDLVFFGYYGSAGIEHVGIYLGDGLFIHSSTQNGIIKTPLNKPYYVANYKGATRIIR